MTSQDTDLSTAPWRSDNRNGEHWQTSVTGGAGPLRMVVNLDGSGQDDKDDVEKEMDDDDLETTSNVGYNGSPTGERLTSGQNKEQDKASTAAVSSHLSQNSTAAVSSFTQTSTAASSSFTQTSLATSSNFPQSSAAASADLAQNSTAVASDLAQSQSSSGTVVVLLQILATMKDQAQAVNSLQESTKEVFLALKNLENAMAGEMRQTNSLLQTLVEKSEKPSTVSSDDIGSRANSFNLLPLKTTNDFNISEKHLFPMKILEHLTARDMQDAIQQKTERVESADAIPLSPDHPKDCVHPLHQYVKDPHDVSEPVPEMSKPESGRERERASAHPPPTVPASDLPVDASLRDSRNSSSQASQSTTMKENTKLSFSKQDALRNLSQNIPENRRPSSGGGTSGARPKEPTPSARKPPSGTGSSDVRPKEPTASPRKPSSGGGPPDVRPKEPTANPRAPSSDSGTADTRPREPSVYTSRRSGHRNQISAHAVTISTRGDSESQRLHEALDRARAPVANPPPRARSFDTLLCLDTSESMLQWGAFEQMKKVVTEFINGVEDMTSDVEENVGLVTFGGRANITQHLTNDFSLVREAFGRITCGGSSPFFEAMVVCLGAFESKSGTVSVSGEYDIHPRIIFISDGHITEGTDDPFDRVIDATNTRASFSRLMMDLNPKKDPSMPHPIIFVPVGSRADRVFLRSMAQLNDGQLIDPENLTSICNYFKIQETIGKVIVCIRNMRTEDTSEHEIRNVIQALVPSITTEEMNEVVDAVCKETKNPTKRKSRSDPLAFDEVYEDTEAVAAGERLPLGTRVVRGMDWRWGSQDSDGPGTVIQHEEKTHGFTWVLWDGGHNNRYPYGAEMGYHIWPTDTHPLLRTDDGTLKIGMRVKKGPRWNHPRLKFDTETGIIIRRSRSDRLLKVRWANGVIEACPVYAVEFSDPFEEGEQSSGQQREPMHRSLTEIKEEEEEDMDNKIPVWQWRDDWGNWRLYSRQETEKLEAAYQRKKNGTCIILRGNKQLRVLFQRKTEKDVDKSTERDIQRIFLPEDELQSLQVAEEFLLRE